jgi:hypothetical protein
LTPIKWSPSGVLHNGEFPVSPRPCRLSAVTPGLAGLLVEVGDPPGAMSKLFRALGLHVAVLDDVAAELRLDRGGIIQFRRGTAPTRSGLHLAVTDLCGAARALDAERIGWDITGPNRIRVKHDALTVDVTEGRPGLTTVTLFVTDVAAAGFWRSLGLEVVDATTGDTDPTDPAEPAADVDLGDVTLRLRGCGLGAVALCHMVIRVAAPRAGACGLIEIGCGFRIVGEAVVTRTPDGGGLRLVPPRR